MSTATPQAHASHKGAIPLLIVGVFALATCIALTIMQIQTNESLFLHGPAILSRPRWETLIQPYDFVVGNLDSDMTKAFIWAWVSQVLYLIIIVGFEHALHAVHSTWSKLKPLFVIVALGLVGYNIYTDYMYGPSGFWTQLGFALAMSTAVIFFGIVGSAFLGIAIGKIRH